jgi:hypothetical protein
MGATVGFDRIYQKIRNPYRDDERGIDAANFPAHTPRNGDSFVSSQDYLTPFRPSTWVYKKEIAFNA